MIILNKNIALALAMLKENGFDCYIVGGSLRDALLNRSISDYDITTNARPEEIKSVFKNYKCLDIGMKHGTITVFINSNKIEITTYRIDGSYINNRKPKKVNFTNSLFDDLKRRDFTINALCFNEENGLIDFFNGKKDIENKIIRCIGNPDERFKEDALRILRAIRFKAQLNFAIEKNTKKAIFINKKLLINISQQRINDEFFKIINTNNYLNVLKEYEDVFKVIFPKINIRKVKGNFNIKLAVLLKNSELDKLSLSKNTINSIKYINQHINSNFQSKYSIKKALSINSDLFKDILTNKNKRTAKIYQEIINNNEPYSIKHLSINGNDLKNIVPNNKIAYYLKLSLEEVIRYPKHNNKDFLISFIKNR